ncbi:MAG TPA: HEAT repeat domain-containing protein [Bdellovibrionota bacterium]|nr:HEAT repeat domain-containing protein [Bdellovibrionota bacterium]
MFSRFPALPPLLGVTLAILIAATQLGHSLEGSAKIEYLMRELEHGSDYKVRMAAANALGKVADGTVADWMIRALRREDHPAVRLATIYAVGQIPDHRVIAPVLELAHEELLSQGEMLAVERVLWNLRPAIHLSSWIDYMLSAPERGDRAMAAWLVGVTGDASALPALRQVLKDGSAHVRSRAAQAIGRIGSVQGKIDCQRAATKDPDASVLQAGRQCLTLIGLQQSGRIPQGNWHRVNLKVDLYGMQTGVVTPETYKNYLRKNVNPRAVDVAVATLRASQAEIREDRSVHLIEHEQLLRTFRLDATMLTSYIFEPADLGRLRQAVREETPRINRCYIDAVRKNRKLRGNVTVEFRVLNSGRVSNASVKNATLQDIAIQNCIVDEVQKIPFPQIPVRYVKMQYTFSFTPPKDEKFEFAGQEATKK